MSSYLSLSPRCLYGRCVTDYYRHRRRRAAARRRLASIDLTLAAIADPEFLLGVYRELKSTGGPAAGLDGIHYDDLSITEIAAALATSCRCDP